MGDIIHVNFLLQSSTNPSYTHFHFSLNHTHSFTAISLASGTITYINNIENCFVLLVMQQLGPGKNLSTILIHREMLLQPLPPVNQFIVLRGNVLSVRVAEAFLAINNFSVL